MRATVAYKGAWVRATRTLVRDPARAALADGAAERFAAAVAGLPGAAGFAGMASWLVEGCAVAQPLEPLMGSAIAAPAPPPPGALVSVQACLERDGQPILLGGPALVGGSGEASGLLAPPL